MTSLGGISSVIKVRKDMVVESGGLLYPTSQTEQDLVLQAILVAEKAGCKDFTTVLLDGQPGTTVFHPVASQDLLISVPLYKDFATDKAAGITTTYTVYLAVFCKRSEPLHEFRSPEAVLAKLSPPAFTDDGKQNPGYFLHKGNLYSAGQLIATEVIPPSQNKGPGSLEVKVV